MERSTRFWGEKKGRKVVKKQSLTFLVLVRELAVKDHCVLVDEHRGVRELS